MDEFSDRPAGARLDSLSSANTKAGISRTYTRIIKALRVILPLAAVGMTVVVVMWDDTARRLEPVVKSDLVEQSDTVQNELLRPVFNSTDNKEQPFTVSAERATQDRIQSELLNLEEPRAEIALESGPKLGATARRGIYEQQGQKLNLAGDVVLTHSDGYTLSTEELRVDLNTQQAFSGRDVRIESPLGTLDATGLEGNAAQGTLIFTGPAKIVLYSDGGLLSPQVRTP